MKKIINQPTAVVDEMLDGLAYIHSDLVHRVEGFDIIARNSEKSGKVAIISGGGSGHEPAHAGFVGDGMLSAAICGAVFTSPTPDQVLQAIKEADEGAGVFMVIKNYSGDIMNFEMAQDMAEMEGIEVASVVVDDDIAVEDSLYTQGRRGVAGTILVHKILGNAARSGKSLSEIKALADELVPQIHTVGLALSGATVPEVGKPGFVLADDEIEFGIGIHGEPGYRMVPFESSELLAVELINKIKMKFKWQEGQEFILLINNLGGTSKLEELVFTDDILQLLDIEGLKLPFVKTGHLITSLDMAGLSVTLCHVSDSSWLKALETPTNAFAW